MTGKRNVRPRYAPLKVGQEVALKAEEKVKIRDLGGGVAEYTRFRAGTTGRITVPKLLNGNVVVDIFLLDKGTKGYEITRSNVRVVAKPNKPACGAVLHFENIHGTLVKSNGFYRWKCPACGASGERRSSPLPGAKCRMPAKKASGNCVPKGLDLLSPAERATLSPMAIKHLAASLTNQRRAKKAMMEAIQTYADCTANVSHARRLAHQQSEAKAK